MNMPRDGSDVLWFVIRLGDFTTFRKRRKLLHFLQGM